MDTILECVMAFSFLNLRFENDVKEYGIQNIKLSQRRKIMASTSTLNANGVEIGVIGNVADESAYISLTDIARKIQKMPLV